MIAAKGYSNYDAILLAQAEEYWAEDSGEEEEEKTKMVTCLNCKITFPESDLVIDENEEEACPRCKDSMGIFEEEE